MTHPAPPLINLVPQRYTQVRWKAIWIRRWLYSVVGTMLIIGIPGIYIGLRASLTTPEISEHIEHVKQDNAKYQQTIPLLQRDIKYFTIEQRTYDLIDSRIDWRSVFSLLISRAENRIRFQRLHATGGGLDGKSPILIELEGLAPSQTSIRDYVVDLENADIFDTIDLLSTERKNINQVDLISFKIAITITSTTISGQESANEQE